MSPLIFGSSTYVMRSSRFPGMSMMPSDLTTLPLIDDVVAGFVTYLLAESFRAPLRFRMFSAQFRVSRLFFLGGQPFDLLEPAGFELILALLLGDADGGREVAVLVRCLEAASEVSPFRVARGGGGGTGSGRRSISLDRGSLPGPGHR